MINAREARTQTQQVRAEISRQYQAAEAIRKQKEAAADEEEMQQIPTTFLPNIATYIQLAIRKGNNIITWSAPRTLRQATIDTLVYVLKDLGYVAEAYPWRASYTTSYIMIKWE